MLRFFNRLGIQPAKSLEEWIGQTRSYDGYEREAAIHALRGYRDGAAIACLLARANDWVPAVRNAATLALGDFLTDAFASDWIAALESLVALERAQRANHDALLSAVAALLGKPRHQSALLHAASQGSHAVRRYVFEVRFGQTLENESRVQLLMQAILGDDLPIARRALDLARDGMSADGAERVARAACRSRFSEMRAAGLRCLVALGPAFSRQLVYELGLDRSSGVRAIALHTLRAWHEESLLLDLVLARLDDANTSARNQLAALQVLYSLRPDASLGYCEQAIRSPSAALRCAAYAQLLAIGSEQEKDALILRALADKSSRVQGVAVQAVRCGALPPASDAVLSIALRHGTERAVYRAVSMFRYYSYWARLIALLRGLDSQVQSGHRAVWLDALVQWEIDGTCNFVAPSLAQRQEIEALWKNCAAHVPDTLGKKMGFYLSAYGLGKE